MPLFRSLLFAPGNHPRKVEKCLGLDADVVILDLEDAVAIAEKEATRSVVVDALANRPHRARGYVRVNAVDTPFCWGDLQAVVTPGVDGIVLPKLESASDLRTVDWVVSQLERERGMEAGAFDILPIIETGKGVAAVASICESGDPGSPPLVRGGGLHPRHGASLDGRGARARPGAIRDRARESVGGDRAADRHRLHPHRPARFAAALRRARPRLRISRASSASTPSRWGR